MSLLQVYVEETFDKGVVSRSPVWSLYGDQGNSWKLAQIYPMNVTSPTFHFLFLARATGGIYGDTAIDDVTIKSCPSSPPPPLSCPPNEWRCANGRECIPMIQRCNGTKNCKDGSDELGCLTECHDLFCVSGGTCYIQFGEAYCHCLVGKYEGRRCEKPIPMTPALTMKPIPMTPASTMPVTTRAPTLAPTEPACLIKACNAAAKDCFCSVLREPSLCLTCETDICRHCVCQVIVLGKLCSVTQILVSGPNPSSKPRPTELARSTHHGILCVNINNDRYFFHSLM